MTRAPLHPDFLHRPIAHRGLHDRGDGRPENSRAAFRAAIAQGYGIELDLQPAADNTPMVFHDEDLARLTGAPGEIRSRSPQELSQLGLIGNDEPIPTLAEILKLTAGQVPLLIEIKDQTGDVGADTSGFEAAIAKVLAGYQGPVAVMSFNPHAIRAFAAAAPTTTCGLTTGSFDPAYYVPLSAERCASLRDIPDFDPALHSFISHEARDLARPRVAEIARQAEILCWTIRSPEQEAEARQFARNITFEGYDPAQ